MFGPDILVAPVVEKGAVTRRVYLPEGVEWTDAHTKKILTGGQWIESEAPLEKFRYSIKTVKTYIFLNLNDDI